jgi:cephalosporin hydroxylase
MQSDIYFPVEDEKIKDHEKPVLMASYMRGRAQKWVTPYLKKYLDDYCLDAGITKMF